MGRAVLTRTWWVIFCVVNSKILFLFPQVLAYVLLVFYHKTKIISSVSKNEMKAHILYHYFRIFWWLGFLRCIFFLFLDTDCIQCTFLENFS